MATWKSPPRSAQTTIACARCKKPLMARRSCHEARLHCEGCGKDYAIGDYIKEMDEALEQFLEALNCDRV